MSTFADITGMKESNNINNIPSLIIKPKQKQICEKTEMELQKNINPAKT